MLYIPFASSVVHVPLDLQYLHSAIAVFHSPCVLDDNHPIMATIALTRVDSGRESTNLEVYFKDDNPVISRQAHEILVEYSGIPEDQLISHVRAVVRSPISRRVEHAAY